MNRVWKIGRWIGIGGVVFGGCGCPCGLPPCGCDIFGNVAGGLITGLVAPFFAGLFPVV